MRPGQITAYVRFLHPFLGFLERSASVVNTFYECSRRPHHWSNSLSHLLRRSASSTGRSILKGFTNYSDGEKTRSCLSRTAKRLRHEQACTSKSRTRLSTGHSQSITVNVQESLPKEHWYLTNRDQTCCGVIEGARFMARKRRANEKLSLVLIVW